MSVKQRIEKMEQHVPSEPGPQFYCYLDEKWTEEQKAEALRAHPNCTFFWRTLSSTLPIEEIRRRQDAGESLINHDSRHVALGSRNTPHEKSGAPGCARPAPPEYGFSPPDS